MDSEGMRDRLERCHRESFAWALNCCDRDRAEAEDVLQTVYLKVLDGRARFDGRSSFTTWLFAVIRRTAAEERRRGASLVRRLLALHEDPAELRSPTPEADRDVEDAERESLIEGALASLAARQREVILLVFYHERTVEEAAEIMGIAVGSARTHYARGKERLRALLGDSLITP